MLSKAQRALARSLGVAALATTLAAAPAAGAQFTSIQAFGDSYVDTGNLFPFLPPAQQAIYPTGRFSGGTNYVDTLSFIYGLPVFNYAWGGAETGFGNVVPGAPGFAFEWLAFIGLGGRILPSDLVLLNIGGNDARAYYQGGGTVAGAPAAAATSAAQALTGVGALVGVGARTLVFSVGNVAALPEAATAPGDPAAGAAFSTTYNLLTQAGLGAMVAATGVRVEYVNVGLIGAEIRAFPALYGIANTGACPLACVGNPALQNQYLFYVDGIHLTSAGFAIMAEYIANRLNAPLTFAAQGDIGLTATTSFLANMFGRLDLFNARSGLLAPRVMSYAERTRHDGPLSDVPASAPPSPLSAYIAVNGGFGSRSATGVSNGYDWDSVGGTIGLEYRIGSNALVGAAFNYANPTVRQLLGAGKTDVNAYQFGLYGAWNGASLFAQAALSWGLLDYANWRPGVVSPINSNAKGSTFAAAFKGGYLFDLSDRFRLGPILGLTYASARVDAYNETGDPVLTLALGRQKVETLVGSAGAQARYAFSLGARRIDSFLNLTAEEDFHGSGRSIRYSALSAPLIVNTWTIPHGSRDPYGRVALGASTDLASNIAVNFTVSRTFARKGGDDFTGQGGLRYAF